MANRKKTVLLILILFILGAACTAYYLYNKTGTNVEAAEGKKVNAADLYAVFLHDSLQAKRGYINRVVEVSGMITSVTENQRHQQLVMLKTGVEGAAVNCTMEGAAGKPVPGDKIIIKGICNGLGEGDPDLGIMADLYLVRCYLPR